MRTAGDIEAVPAATPTAPTKPTVASTKPRLCRLALAALAFLAMVGGAVTAAVVVTSGNGGAQPPTATTRTTVDADAQHAIEDLEHFLHETNLSSTPASALLASEHESFARRALHGRRTFVQCGYELTFGDCFNRKRAESLLPSVDVTTGWNSAAGARPAGIASSDALFGSNAWTAYEHSSVGRRNGYITHYLDGCSICSSSRFSNAVQAFLAVESRPLALRLHQSGYEEFVGSRDAITDPIGGYLNYRQRYVHNGPGALGTAPGELVLQTFYGGSPTVSFATRGPGFFYYYTLESPSRGRVLVVVDSEPPACCSPSS